MLSAKGVFGRLWRVRNNKMMPRTPDEWFVWYVRRLGNIAPNTTLQRHAVLKRYFDWLNGRPPATINYDDLTNYQRHLNGCKASTARQYLVILKSFYGHIIDAGFMIASPFDSFKMPKKKKTERIGYDHREAIPRLLAACKNERERFIFSLACMSGLRLSELTSLTWDRVLVEEQQLDILGKGSKERRIIISGELQELLERNRNGCPYVISNSKTGSGMKTSGLYSLVKVIAIRAGYPKLSPHDLRRIYSGWFLSLGNDPACLQEQLGHSHVTTTLECYTIPTDSKKREIANQMRLPS